MAKRVSLSREKLGIEQIWDWYETTSEALNLYKIKLKNLVLNSEAMTEGFEGYSINEIDYYFLKQNEELEQLTSLNLLASVEASFRVDFLSRVYNKKRDDLSRAFRDLYNEYGNKISLEEHILEIWKEKYPITKQIVGDFKSALKYRHWLAHGRYWNPKLGRTYDAYAIYFVCDNIITNLNL